MTYPIRKITLLFLIVGFSPSMGVDQNSYIGKWQGNLSAGNQTISFTLNLNNEKSTFDIPQIGLFAYPISNLNFEENKFVFRIQGREEIVVEGTVNGSELTAKAAGTNMNIQLKKISETPDEFYEENVTYKSGDINLAGTLIKPNKNGTYPAVVFIHGSGKMTRETMRNRAYQLVNEGCAALIFDRRGRGESGGEDMRILPMQTMAEDALAGVKFLKSRDDILKDKISLYGLSQGAWVASLAASMSADVSFLITVSASGVNPDKQDIYLINNIVQKQISKSLSNLNIPADVKENVASQQTMSKEDAYKLVDNKDEELVPGFFSFEPAPVWEKIKVPVLALWGEQDKIVPPDESKQIIKEALRKANNQNAKLVMIPNANHTLEIVGKQNKFANKWDLIAPSANEALTDWIRKNITAAK